MSKCVLIDGRPAQFRPRGTGTYVLRLLPALAAAALKDRTVQLKVALDKSYGGDPWPKLDSVKKVWGKGLNPAHWEQSILPNLARQAGAELIHCPANSSPLRSKIPYVVTIHDTIFMRSIMKITGSLYLRQILAHLYYKFGIAISAKRAVKILTDSEYSKSDLVTKLHLPAEKIHVIPLAAPQTAPLPENKVKEIHAALEVNRPYVLGFGAIDVRKNTANLVRAFARLPRSAVDTLVLAGFEKARKSGVPQLIKHLGLAKRVKILDYVSEQELTALFQGAAAFVYPTRMEGFGLPILQAFHLGVPVVTSRVGSVPEVAGDAVRFADPEDPRSISQEILSILIDSNEAHRLALSGYLQAKHFSWEQTSRETLEVYQEALNTRE